MKTNTDLDSLLKKILDGNSTAEEKLQFYDLIQSPDNERLIKEILYKQLTEFNEDYSDSGNSQDFDRIYNSILNEIEQKNRPREKSLSSGKEIKLRRKIINTLTIAAISAAAFFLGSLYSRTQVNKSTNIVSVISFSEIKAPYGSNSEILLPDSTKVILNAGSSIRYSSNFNVTNRDLVLVGEALFKVAKNLDIPLNVNAGDINVKAVGTEFNIKAYDDESIIETTLIEGKVEISQLLNMDDKSQFIDLIPNQKAIYIKETESFNLEKIRNLDSLDAKPVRTLYENILISPKVDVSQVVAWTKGRLVIRGERLDNLCIELQRKYDVSIVFSDEKIKKYRFTGVLMDETLEQVLNVIKLTAPIEYSLKGKTVYMSSDTEQLNDYSKHLR
ncbi:MAG: FecR family protein [Bacteroidales bacterium]|nr:FecR family protein [Bacteroidales bacterium]